MHPVSMHAVIIMRSFIDFFMDESMHLVSMHAVIIIMRSFIDFIMDAFMGMVSIERAVMH
ncbi:MAG: hypothetical protein STSR0009_28890 [Methanoregula sp.]